MSFKLFPFLEWTNVKKLSDSFEKKLYNEEQNLFAHDGYMNDFNDVSTSFGLIKTCIIIQALLNKKTIEKEAELYTDIELNEESKHEVIHNRLPYFKVDGVRIYVPFFTREFNIHYDTKLNSLSKPPFNMLKEDFYSSILNDPFDVYGIALFDSPFTRLIKIKDYPKDNVAVFYHIDFETIYVITNQGTLEVEIPIFDNAIKHPNKENIFERIVTLMDSYFETDREKFIENLRSQEFISNTLYEEIVTKSTKKQIKRQKLVHQGRDLDE